MIKCSLLLVMLATVISSIAQSDQKVSDQTTNPLIQKRINYYQGLGRSTMEADLRRSGKFMALARRVFREEGVPVDLTWIAQVESEWNPKSSTPRGDGLWQFPVSRGRVYGLKMTPWINERMSLEQATRAAARYLKALGDRYNGNWELAMAAYHMGEGETNRAISTAGSADFWAIYPYLTREKRNYVPNVLATMLIAKNPEKYGFGNISPDAPLSYDVVQVLTATSLHLAAQASSSNIDYIRMLNPELRRDTTPPGDAYNLRISSGKARQFVAALKGIPPDRRNRSLEDSKKTTKHRTKKINLDDFDFSGLRELNEWPYVGSSTYTSAYYGTKTIRRLNANIVRVWTKSTLKDETDQTKTEFLRNRTAQGLRIYGYANYSHTLELDEYNCAKGEGRVLSNIDYDEKGSVIDSTTYRRPGWDYIVPKSIGESLFLAVCKRAKGL